jgi:hypothetical protein
MPDEQKSLGSRGWSLQYRPEMQRCNVLFGQTLPFAIKVHPLIALNAAPKPLTQASVSTLFER